MKPTQLIIPLTLLLVLLVLNQFAPAQISFGKGYLGGMPLLGWILLGGSLVGMGLVFALRDASRARRLLEEPGQPPTGEKPPRKLSADELKELKIDDYNGPEYPHPVIFRDRCIGCHACVDACPHDVLAIVDGASSPIAPDQCMEDTACQVECPVNPKACIVINTTKVIRPRPAPQRDGASFMTNVSGCYVVGDVSGVPLIKNAAKEGAEVIETIAAELAKAAPEPKAQYDVVIIGVGPAGASAAVTAQVKGLKYLALEQSRILETIVKYPKGKYVFFKPDTKDWQGGIEVAGMGTRPDKTSEDQKLEDEQIIRALGASGLGNMVTEQSSVAMNELLANVPSNVKPDATNELNDRMPLEIRRKLREELLAGEADAAAVTDAKLKSLFEAKVVNAAPAARDEFLARVRNRILDFQTHKILGEQRERILDLWLGTIRDKNVVINENESCKAIEKAADGDYFSIRTERGSLKETTNYTARRVIIAIGLSGTPMKLGVPGEEIKLQRDGREESKVLYSLSDPEAFRQKHFVIVGGGNSAIEAAVDLVARRDGDKITFRPPEERNHVTLLVRSDFKGDLKFGNKMQIYQCIDAKVLDVRFGVAIKQITPTEVTIEDARSKEVKGTLPNDYIIALIGGDKPDKFLKGIGITIG